MRRLFVAGALFLAALTQVTVISPALGTWRFAAPLPAARANHTATLLKDGQILVAGGLGSRGASADAELYQPGANRWQPTGRMRTARWNHTATALLGGRVLVAGGEAEGGPPLQSAEIFSPDVNQWLATAGMAHPRFNHTATLLRDGRVLVVGGEDAFGLLDSAEVYEPATGRWTPAGSLATPRSGHTASLLANGDVLVGGGESWGPTAETYHPSANRWSSAGQMISPRAHQTMTTLPNGKLLAVGAVRPDSRPADSEIYDPTTDRWAVTPSGPPLAPGHQAVLLQNGWVLALGGHDTKGHALPIVKTFDPQLSREWPVQSLKVPRVGHTATLLHDGSVLVVGGISEAAPTESSELYRVNGGLSILNEESVGCLKLWGCVALSEALSILCVVLLAAPLLIRALPGIRRRLRIEDPDSWLPTEPGSSGGHRLQIEVRTFLSMSRCSGKTKHGRR